MSCSHAVGFAKGNYSRPGLFGDVPRTGWSRSVRRRIFRNHGLIGGSLRSAIGLWSFITGKAEPSPINREQGRSLL